MTEEEEEKCKKRRECNKEAAQRCRERKKEKQKNDEKVRERQRQGYYQNPHTSGANIKTIICILPCLVAFNQMKVFDLTKGGDLPLFAGADQSSPTERGA